MRVSYVWCIVNAKIAEEDACKLQQYISDESLQAIKAFIQK